MIPDDILREIAKCLVGHNDTLNADVEIRSVDSIDYEGAPPKHIPTGIYLTATTPEGTETFQIQITKTDG